MAETPYDPDYDPFTSIGGGVKLAAGGWVPKGHPDATSQPLAPIQPSQTGTQAPPVQGGPVTAQQAITGTATAGGQIAQGTPTTAAGAFQQALINKLAPAPVNAQNPEIRPAIDAYNLQEQRGMERNQQMLAERSAAQGFDASGGFESQLLGLAQDRAARESAFTGDAVRALGDRQAKDQTIANALVGSMLGQQDVLAQQRQAMELEAMLRREGYDVQRQGIDADLQARMAGVDVQRFSAETDAAVRMKALEYQKYGIDAETATKMAQLDVQRYGISSDAATRMAGYDVQRYGIDQDLLAKMAGLETQRYGIDQDAATRMAGYDVQRDLGLSDIDLRRDLGYGNLNLGLLGLMQSGDQFNQNLGAQLGMFGANLNQAALLSLLGGL